MKANTIIEVKRAAGRAGAEVTNFRFHGSNLKRRGLEVIKNDPIPLKDNDGGSAYAAHKDNYKGKEKEERSDEPRPEPGSSSLEEKKEGIQEEQVLSPSQPVSLEVTERGRRLAESLESLNPRKRKGAMNE